MIIIYQTVIRPLWRTNVNECFLCSRSIHFNCHCLRLLGYVVEVIVKHVNNSVAGNIDIWFPALGEQRNLGSKRKKEIVTFFYCGAGVNLFCPQFYNWAKMIFCQPYPFAENTVLYSYGIIQHSVFQTGIIGYPSYFKACHFYCFSKFVNCTAPSHPIVERIVHGDKANNFSCVHFA